MRHDDKLPEGYAHIQCATLFTSCSGQRRLRVHNLTLLVSGDYNLLYRVADHGALVSFLFKQGIGILITSLVVFVQLILPLISSTTCSRVNGA